MVSEGEVDDFETELGGDGSQHLPFGEEAEADDRAVGAQAFGPLQTLEVGELLRGQQALSDPMFGDAHVGMLRRLDFRSVGAKGQAGIRRGIADCRLQIADCRGWGGGRAEACLGGGGTGRGSALAKGG
jgi:hypothetical protein